jgi:hypothetical protein
MPLDEDLTAKVLELLPTHPSIEALQEAHALRDVRLVDIRNALRVLQERGHVRAGELFRRD